MTSGRSYRLPSIAVTSSFDRPAVVHTVPAVLENRDSGIAVIEGGFGLPTRICRFVRPSGMVAVQLAERLPETMLVSLRLTCDTKADEWWLSRRDVRAESAALRGLAWEGPDATVRGLHRFLRVGVQGRPRAHLLLDDPESAGLKRTTQEVVLSLRREDVDESGLLLVSLTAAAPPPDWGGERVLPEPLVGVQGTRLRVDADDDGARPIGTSTGRQGEGGWQPWSPSIGYAALNRGDVPVRLHVSHREATRRWSLRGASSRGWPEEAEIFDGDGTLRTIEVPKPGHDGVSALDVPGSGPALVRFPGLSEDAAQLWIRLSLAHG